MSNTAWQEVTSDRQDAVGIVTMNAPQRRNALSLIMRRELTDAIADLDADPKIRAVILTGAGGNFCAGGDLKSMDGLDDAAGRARLQEAHLLVRQIATMATPVIAAVDGYAYGAGLSIAALCDIVVTAPDASWCCAFGKVGLMPDLGTTWVLPRRIGVGRARLLAFTARRIDGRQAVDWGLADQIAGDKGGLATATQIAEEIGACAPLATASAKRAFGHPELSLDVLLETEVDAQAGLFLSDDFAEGRSAFFAKRPPQFRGR